MFSWLCFFQWRLRSGSSAPAAALGGWRFITQECGARSAMTAGTWRLLLWSADRWTVALHSVPQHWPSLVQELGPSGSMTSAAQGLNSFWAPVSTIHTGFKTVSTVKTLVSCVKVRKCLLNLIMRLAFFWLCVYLCVPLCTLTLYKPFHLHCQEL